MVNKKYLSSILILVIAFTFLIGCQGEVNIPDDINLPNDESTITNQDNNKYQTLIVDDYNNLNIDKLNIYEISVDFNPDERTYTASQSIDYFNNEEINLDSIYFHIYPNAFKEQETAPILFNSSQSSFPNRFEPGYIDIDNISVEDKIINNYVISGVGNTILKIPLKQSLKPGEKINIDMNYTVKLPFSEDRFGYGEKTYNLGNWYPIAAVYDDEGWNLDPYYSIGDPFYSDTSNYYVTIKAPKEFIIASSGNILSEEVNGNYKNWKIEAKLMRDFAWVASEHFNIIQKNVDGTLVKNYFLDNNSINNFAANTAYDSIKIFNQIFGKYPYGQYSVVAANFPSGMEYPGIVFIGEKYYNHTYKNYLETVIVHETGHQWWYNVVGNDSIDEAWLDESLTTYSEVIYMDEKYSEKAAQKYYNERTKEPYNYTKDYLGDEVILKPLSEFNNWTDYGSLTYNKGAMFIHEIKEIYGEETLYSIFKEYYDRFKFLNATTDDFIDVCEEITGDDFSDLVDKWLYSR